MIPIDPISTARLQVRLKELTAADAIMLCDLPFADFERGASRLLQSIVVEDERPRRGQVQDPRLWTAQERALVISHYLAYRLTGDFEIGDNARYSDYVMETMAAPPEPVFIGEIAGERWMLQPLLGWHAESIERLVESESLTPNRNGWSIGAIGAMAYAESEGPLDAHELTDAAADGALAERISGYMRMSESDFMSLHHAFFSTLPALDHVFRMAILDDGFGWLPATEVPGKPPARFPFSLAVRADTAQVFGAAF